MDNYMKVIINAIKQWVESTLAIFNNALEKKIDNDFIVFGDTLENKINNKIDDVAAKIPEQVKPDWNQNDSNELDYIKNRPFYEEMVTKVYAQEQTAMFGEAGYSSIRLEGEYLEFPEDYDTEGYVITLDGVIYDNLQVAEIDHGEYLGFVIITDDGKQLEITDNLYIRSMDLIGEHTIKIERNINNITPIDDRFLAVPMYKGEGYRSICFNNKYNLASDWYSHAEGEHTTASGRASHAEGSHTVASGGNSHAEGEYTTASDFYSHAEGGHTVASARYSHAEGEYTIASGRGSHAEGLNNTTFGDYQFVHGKNNKKEYDEYTEEYNFTSSSYGYASNTYVYDNISGLFTLGDDALGVYAGKVNNKYWIEKKATGSEMYYIESFPKAIKYTSSARQFAHIIGNGLDENNNSNAHTLDWSGNAWYQGDVYVGSTSGTNRDDGSKKLATEQYVNDAITAIDIPDAPVQSVNNKTGAVTLTAFDVGARPSTWMPSASEVGADASGTASSVVSTHNTATNAHADIRAEIEAVDAKIVDEIIIMTQNTYSNMTQSDLAELYSKGVRMIAITDVVYTNLVPLSIDADGNIYNGTGYKNGYRLNSSGLDTTLQTDSAVTGFIPYTYTDIIRIKNAEWLYDGQDKHFYICAYDSNKQLLYSIGHISYKAGDMYDASITYDAISGVTTFDLSHGVATSEWFIKWQKAAYVRLNALGNGAELVVTINEEI